MNLRHDGIVWIQGVSGNETSSLVVMEYLPGGSLEDRMVMPQPLHEALRVTTAVSRALSFAHTNRIVHGNLKPSNVLFTGTDLVKVADFGMNRGEAESTLFSPDGVCEDIFSMGRLLYHMVVGFEPVFKADGGFAPHKQFKNLPSEVKSLILRMLSRNTETGYRSMAQVLADLEGIYRPDTDSDRTVLNLDESLFLMARKTLQNSVMTVKRWWVAGVILLGVAALVALGITLLK
jgi:serine/threonine-protein kinase